MFSVEGVAARAGTGKASIYRRWPTKQELVTDALLASLPDPAGVRHRRPTSPTRSRPRPAATASPARSPRCCPARPATPSAPSSARRPATRAWPQLIDERFQAPRRAAMLGLLRRGIERGEVRPGADIALVADVLPAVLAHRVILQRAADHRAHHHRHHGARDHPAGRGPLTPLVVRRARIGPCRLSARWPCTFEGRLEASPSLVYGAALLMRFGSQAHPGFESRSLRSGPSSSRRSAARLARFDQRP